MKGMRYSQLVSSVIRTDNRTSEQLEMPHTLDFHGNLMFEEIKTFGKDRILKRDDIHQAQSSKICTVRF